MIKASRCFLQPPHNFEHYPTTCATPSSQLYLIKSQRTNMTCFSIPPPRFTKMGDCADFTFSKLEEPMLLRPYKTPFSSDVDREELQIDQDETSVRLTLEMTGVKGRDLVISIEDHNILTIEGYRRVATAGGRCKKQKLQRRFALDTSIVDVSRAVANIWKDTLVLYAPKRPTSISIPITEQPDFEFSTPAADLLWERETARAA